MIRALSRHIGLLIFALFIDAFQGLVMLALAGVMAGITVGVGWIPIVGQIVAGATDAMGIILGMVVDFALSVTMGTGLVVGMLSTKLLRAEDIFTVRRLPFIMGKFVPFINALPLYTGLVIMSALKDEQRRQAAKKKKGGKGLAARALTLAAPEAAVPLAFAQRASRMTAPTASPVSTQKVTSSAGPRVDGIRPKDIRMSA